MRHWLDRPLTKKEIKELEESQRTTAFMLNAAIVFFVICCSIAATQNFERDVSEGLVEAHEKEELFPLYLKEAESVIKTTKQNYRPELPNIDHITLRT